MAMRGSVCSVTPDLGGLDAVPTSRNSDRTHGSTYCGQPGVDRHVTPDVPGLRGHVAKLAHGPIGMPASHGARLSLTTVPRHGHFAELYPMALDLRYGADVSLSQASAQTLAVEVPARSVVTKDAIAHDDNPSSRRH